MTYSIMIDSGAYSAHTRSQKLKAEGKKDWEVEINIKEYMQFIEDNKEYIDHYINLDVLGDGYKSYTNYQIMLSEGFNPVPVFHIGTDERYLKRYLDKTDYIAIGAIAKMNTKSRMISLDNLWNNLLTNDQHYPIAKFHGFGLTSFRIIKYYPWFSVDSSSWVQYGRYGLILVPKYKNREWNYNGDPWKILVTSRAEKHKRDHILKLPGLQKEKILEYIEGLGFDYKSASTDGIVRDTINLAYMLGMQAEYFGRSRPLLKPRNTRRIIKKLIIKEHEFDPTDGKMFTAGNFPVMKSIEKERAILRRFPTQFHRLISYYFKKDIQTVLQLKKEEMKKCGV